MKLKLILLAFAICFICASAFAVQHFWRGETMTSKAAAKKWGQAEFDTAQFKQGDLKTRASMAASLLERQKEFKGKSILEIRDLLGPTSGFYFSDVYPTYLVQIGKNHSEESWQLVFLLDNDRKVDGIIIHKNCCEK